MLLTFDSAKHIIHNELQLGNSQSFQNWNCKFRHILLEITWQIVD